MISPGYLTVKHSIFIYPKLRQVREANFKRFALLGLLNTMTSKVVEDILYGLFVGFLE